MGIASGIGTSSGGGSGAMTSLGTATVTGSAATSLTISGLDLSAYRCFKLVGKIKNADASDRTIAMTYNSDTTATNYHRQVLAGFGGSTAGGAANDAQFLNLKASSHITFEGSIMADVDGCPRAQNWCNEGQTSANMAYRGYIHRWVTAANVTSITFTASSANALAVGSTVTVYGVT